MSTLGSTIAPLHPETFGGKRAYSIRELSDALATVEQLRNTVNDPVQQQHLDIVKNILKASTTPGACREEMSDLLECIYAKEHE